MSVLVKGMEMPRDCPMCPVAHYNAIAEFTGCEVVPGKRYAMSNDPEYRNSSIRPDWCPLIEVPTPHGRLIDADAMASDEADAYLSAQIAIASAGGKDSEYEALMDINDLVHKKLQMLLKDAPTVIEAEEQCEMNTWKCSRICDNKTDEGYCLTTACINPMYSNIGTYQYGQGVQRNRITNAGRIRSMTDEEIAEWFGVEMGCGSCERMTKGCGKPCTTYANCIKHWFNWLQEEVKE